MLDKVDVGARVEPAPVRSGLGWSRGGITPRVVALVAVAVALFVVWQRLDSFGIDAFFLYGDRFASQAPEGLHRTYPDDGYDGQFFHMLALDPTAGTFETVHDLDGHTDPHWQPYRHQRILYPLLGTVLSFGSDRLLPYALVAVNVLAFGLLAFAGARVAVAYGRSAVWGLSLALWPGFAVSLARGTAEVVAAGFVALGVAAMLERRDWAAVVALCAAVLTRETTVVFAAAALLVVARRDGWQGASRYTIPLVVFGGWQLLLWQVWGVLPATVQSHVLVSPLSGAAVASDGWGWAGWVLAGVAVVLVLVGGAAVLRRLALTVPAVALPFYGLLMFSMYAPGWLEPEGFLRAGSGAAVAAGLAVLEDPWLARVFALLAAGGFGVMAWQMVGAL